MKVSNKIFVDNHQSTSDFHFSLLEFRREGWVVPRGKRGGKSLSVYLKHVAVQTRCHTVVKYCRSRTDISLYVTAQSSFRKGRSHTFHKKYKERNDWVNPLKYDLSHIVPLISIKGDFPYIYFYFTFLLRETETEKIEK